MVVSEQCHIPSWMCTLVIALFLIIHIWIFFLKVEKVLTWVILVLFTSQKPVLLTGVCRSFRSTVAWIEIQDAGRNATLRPYILHPNCMHLKAKNQFLLQLGSTEVMEKLFISTVKSNQSVPSSPCSHFTCFCAEGQLNIHPECHPQQRQVSLLGIS